MLVGSFGPGIKLHMFDVPWCTLMHADVLWCTPGAPRIYLCKTLVFTLLMPQIPQSTLDASFGTLKYH